MSQPSILFIGTPDEVQHHAAPLALVPEWTNGTIEIVPPESAVGRAQPGDLAIFFSEHFDRFRQTCVELKTKHVATLYMIDGILEWRNAWENRTDEPACPFTMRPVLADKVACIGESQARVLRDWGNGPKIEVVGVPRFDSLRAHVAKPNSDRSDSLRSDSDRSDSAFRVLVMTAKTPGFDATQIDNAKQAMRDLNAWFSRNPTIDERHVEVVWRITGGIAEELGIENSIEDLSGGELADVLPSVDAVITTPSTAAIEAMLCNLPVALIDYNQSPQYLSAAWQISARQQIESVLPELTNPSETKLLFQRGVLNDSLYPTESATKRMANLINAMLESARGQLENRSPRSGTTPLNFPPGMLQPETISLPTLDHASVYAEHSEFHNADMLQLQSQLAHARREIEHVRSEKDQLQAELDLAHKIFDQIQTHPIAGPIVRMRQKLIDLVRGVQAHRKTRNSTPSIITDAKEDPHPTN